MKKKYTYLLLSIIMILFVVIGGCKRHISDKDNTKSKNVVISSKSEDNDSIINEEDIDNELNELDSAIDKKDNVVGLSEQEKEDNLDVDNSNTDSFDNLNVSLQDLPKKEKSKDKEKEKQLYSEIIKNPKDCLKKKNYLRKIEMSIKECVLNKENEYLSDPLRLTPAICKGFVTKTNAIKCRDFVYRNVAYDKLDISYCKKIINNTLKNTCISYVNGLINKKELLNKQVEQQNNKVIQIIKKVNNAKSVKDCNEIESDYYKTKCISKLASKYKDLRYCKKYLKGGNYNVCINDNFNAIVPVILEEVKKTKNKSLCDKILIKEWVQKCKDL